MLLVKYEVAIDAEAIAVKAARARVVNCMLTVLVLVVMDSSLVYIVVSCCEKCLAL